MPRIVRPARSETGEDPIKALGNMVRAGIIGYLRENGPATRSEIARGIDLLPNTVSNALVALTASELLTPDPPPELARRGEHIRYRVNDEAVSEMYLQLGQAIGEV